MIKINGFILILFLSLPQMLAQDLSAYKLLAHYPLISNSNDELGINDSLELINMPFMGTEGVYSNGVFFNSDRSGSFMKTPYINQLDHDRMAFSIEFKLTDSLLADHVIFLGGANWRWLGSAVSRNQELQFVFNDATTRTGLFLDLGSWNQVTLVYDIRDTIAALYLNDSLIMELQGFIEN